MQTSATRWSSLRKIHQSMISQMGVVSPPNRAPKPLLLFSCKKQIEYTYSISVILKFIGEIPRWSSGQDSMFSMLRAQVQTLVGELRSCKPSSVAPQNSLVHCSSLKCFRDRVDEKKNLKNIELEINLTPPLLCCVKIACGICNFLKNIINVSRTILPE